MTIQWVYKLVTVLVTVGLLSMTPAGALAPPVGPLLMNRIDIASAPVIASDATPQPIPAEQTEEEDSGGWFGKTVDRIGDVAGDVKDTTVDVAESSWEVVKQVPEETWDVVEEIPGSVWDFVEQIPGTIAELWAPIWDVVTTRFEIPGLAEFLADHPLIRMVLIPVMFFFGIAYDGTMSFLDAGLISLVIFVPLIKGVPVFVTGVQKILPWTSETKVVVTSIGRNPNGVIAGISQTIRFSRARSIAPTSSSIQALPHTPGVYVALDASGTPLYVGMTNSLNRRLSEHFIFRQSRFAERTTSVKILPTESPAAARVLECSLIKQLRPTDNILLTGTNLCPIRMPPSPKVFFTP